MKVTDTYKQLQKLKLKMKFNWMIVINVSDDSIVQENHPQSFKYVLWV